VRQKDAGIFFGIFWTALTKKGRKGSCQQGAREEQIKKENSLFVPH